MCGDQYRDRVGEQGMRHSDIIVEDLSEDLEEFEEQEETSGEEQVSRRRRTDVPRGEPGRAGKRQGTGNLDRQRTGNAGRQEKENVGRQKTSRGHREDPDRAVGTTRPGRSDGGEDPDEDREEFSLFREILSWVVPFGLALLAGIFLKTFVVINADVPTGSMENTIMPGDRLIGNRLAYLKAGPERGDIVIFRYPDHEEELFIKRVIGLPGETVDIHEGQIYIDGAEVPITEPYLKEAWTVATGDYHFEIPEGAYLMLGDNRNDSRDARYWTNTYVYEDKILGKAMVVYWPLADIGRLE